MTIPSRDEMTFCCFTKYIAQVRWTKFASGREGACKTNYATNDAMENDRGLNEHGI